MTTRVLLPVDDTEHARRACELALELFSGGTFVLLHVINPSDAGYSSEAAMPTVSNGWYDKQKEGAEALFDDLEAHIADHGEGVTVERCIELGQPPQTIVNYIEESDIDHVVMGSHGRRGVSRLLLGSVAETVVRHSPVPVTVVQ